MSNPVTEAQERFNAAQARLCAAEAAYEASERELADAKRHAALSELDWHTAIKAAAGPRPRGITSDRTPATWQPDA